MLIHIKCETGWDANKYFKHLMQIKTQSFKFLKQNPKDPVQCGVEDRNYILN